MFICEGCGSVSDPGQTTKVLVVSRRKRSYELLDREGRRIRTVSGWEIEREQRLCARCYEEATKDEHRDEATDETGQ